MHRMKTALNTYESVHAYRTAQTLRPEAFNQWSGSNSRLIRFMEYIWKLQGAFEDSDA